MTLFHMTVYGANQMMVQRTLGARTIGGAKKAYLLMGFAAVPIYCLFFFVGVLCFAFYRGRRSRIRTRSSSTSRPRQAFRGWSASCAPRCCASMSTLSSAFNSLATVSMVDFWQRYVRRTCRCAALRLTRWFTIAGRS
jgi:SSS family solute:Na+ symporter